ncbi:MAG TPA: sugar phosphate isomerase/epimerase [Devosiaceae bacterium]
MDISFQLYSARNFPPLADTLAMLARLGYTQVEGFGGLYGDPAGLAAELKKNGLTMPTGHFGLDMLEDTSATMKTAETLGVRNIFCPAIPHDKWKQPEAEFVALAEKLAGLGEIYRKGGFGFGWHNHHFEFWPTASGRLPIDILLEGAPEIDWEMDVAWVVRGGHDPRDFMTRYGSRIVAVHVKDIAPEGTMQDEDGWADVGHGTMDWPGLLQAIRNTTSARYFVMEHDNPSDLERFASRSIEALRSF